MKKSTGIDDNNLGCAVWATWLLHCTVTLLSDTHSCWVGSGQDMVEYLEVFRQNQDAQGCFLFLKNCILELGKLSDRMSECLSLLVEGQNVLASGNHPIESAHAPVFLLLYILIFRKAKRESGALDFKKMTTQDSESPSEMAS